VISRKLLIAIILVIIPVTVIGLYLSCKATSVSEEIIPKVPTYEVTNYIALLKIVGSIANETQVWDLLTKIRFLKSCEEVKGVVLYIDSPGGVAAYVQEIYLAIRDLDSCKPVVAYVSSMALSGGYHIAVAARKIIVAPASMIGNVGVIGFVPPKPTPRVDVLETGPLKQTGLTRSSVVEAIKKLLDEFVNAVVSSRRVTIPITELASGRIFIGLDAVEYGLADMVGSIFDAVEEAAKLAGVTEYRVVSCEELMEKVQTERVEDQCEEISTDIIKSIRQALDRGHVMFYIYVPPSRVHELGTELVATEGLDVVSTKYSWRSSSEGKTVVIDLAHTTSLYLDEVEPLIKYLLSNNVTVLYLLNTKYIDTILEKAQAYIVLAPTKVYSYDEVVKLRRFVEKGGKLLLVADPERGNTLAINTLASTFKIQFSTGYLYIPPYSIENQTNYRDVIGEVAQEHEITKGITKLLLHTATYIQLGTDYIPLIKVSAYSTTNWKRGEYVVMAVSKNGRVVALADLSPLETAYVSEFDNEKLLQNVVKFLMSNEAKT